MEKEIECIPKFNYKTSKFLSPKKLTKTNLTFSIYSGPKNRSQFDLDSVLTRHSASRVRLD